MEKWCCTLETMVKGLEIYKGKRVFLTGHSGFKGSWLVKMLSMAGAHIMGYSLEPNTQPNLYSVLEIDNLCHSIFADIRDKEKLTQCIKDFEPDFIFHLAAQPIVRASYDAPAYTFDTNVIGTANVLEAVQRMNKPNTNTIIITTDKVYQNLEKDYAYKEDDRLGGYDPYSASKACAEIVVSSFRSSFFNASELKKHSNRIVSVRAGNVIGGGDWAKDRLIPDIARALSKKEDVIIRNPSAIRPWQHVFEPLSGYIYVGALMQRGELNEGSVNFGPYPQDTLTVRQMAQMAIEIWNNGNLVFPQLKEQPHEANLLKLDINKALSLGWKPRWNAKQALQASLLWYKAYYEGKEDMIALSEKQLQEYE